MKTFSIAVAVAVVLTFICIQESSAVPVITEQVLEEPVDFDNEADFAESLKMLVNSRQKRELKCKPYCYPKKDGLVCGVRCDF
ncbi:hepcidin-like [Stegastes partitus]|uniref:Hepcidin-like n=1 Tax=Stegastes partitus TaxID=144197 RepID=A0A3B5AFQ3_9TELE|nr:PREDICTED: hepcidin-like [Stegastes partitus]